MCVTQLLQFDKLVGGLSCFKEWSHSNLGEEAVDCGPYPLQFSSNDAAMSTEHALPPAVEGKSGNPPQEEGTFVATSALKS